MFPVFPQSPLFAETPNQKFDRVMGDYLKSFAILINSSEPTPKQISDYQERVRERDELLESQPELAKKWEKIKEAAGPHFLLSGKLPSSL